MRWYYVQYVLYCLIFEQKNDTSLYHQRRLIFEAPTKRLDWLTTLVPFLCILFLCILFIAFPEDSSSVLGSIRFFLGDQFGSFYLLMGLGALFCSLYTAFSRFGSIRLGGKSPRYSNLQWGSMMFTAGLAADILFYSLCEWMFYVGTPSYLRYGFCRTGPLFTRCFTGDRSRGVFISF